MFVLNFRFPANRYHATPWGRNVNEADVAWPPEPWRLLRAFVAVWWRKGNRKIWSKRDLDTLIDAMAEEPPVYRLPEGVIHAHTRHYMPQQKSGKTALIFDGFVRLPENAQIVAAWPNLTLNGTHFRLAEHLAESINYLGRAESWVECQALDKWRQEANCRADGMDGSGTLVRTLAARSPAGYTAERQRLISQAGHAIASSKRATAHFRSKITGRDTLPPTLADALALDTADFQDRGWSRPPAACEVVYSCASEARPGVISRFTRRRRSPVVKRRPTIARFLVAGRPLPRIEDAVKMGELMRLAALARFGWRTDEVTGRSIPCAPWEISGRGTDGRPLKDPTHRHAFWLPEDADSDGCIDHISVYIQNGIDDVVRVQLDRITRLWLAPKQRSGAAESGFSALKEWRLALEGFGTPADFHGAARIFGFASQWQSVTPFLAAGHLKASGYPGEVRRLLKRRGMDAEGVEVEEINSLLVGGAERRALNFHRFRSRGRERQPDTAGALLRITFPKPILGPLAIGFASHFGLGLFQTDENLREFGEPRPNLQGSNVLT